jgi:phospholipid/cholesterol/gamma-HCH transport system permease protein
MPLKSHDKLMNPAAPRIEQQQTPQGAVCAVLGNWTAADLASDAAWRAVSQQLSAVGQPTQASWSLLHIDQLDHLGAQLLWTHWGRAWPAQIAIAPHQRTLIETVGKFAVQPAPSAPPDWKRPLTMMAGLGSRTLGMLDHIKSLVRLIGQLLLDIIRLARHPQEGPWRDLSGHLYHIGATALPITALVGFLIGVVLAYLISQQLKQFGADAFIVNILGISLIRELGPVLAAILIAGRSGSAITAQIGVMRVTEELDAMRVMGIARGFRLVMPRALALAVVMPLISVWTTIAALLGGMLAANAAMGITPAFFITALPAAVDIANLALATGKSVVFGVLIALVGCHFGLRVKPNTESLGQGTTASVVTSITVVILVDALFAILFKDVGI